MVLPREKCNNMILGKLLICSENVIATAVSIYYDAKLQSDTHRQPQTTHRQLSLRRANDNQRKTSRLCNF